MIKITIDIPDSNTVEVLAQLKKLSIIVRQSKLTNLDKLTKEDYQRHFLHRLNINRNSGLKYL